MIYLQDWYVIQVLGSVREGVREEGLVGKYLPVICVVDIGTETISVLEVITGDISPGLVCGGCENGVGLRRGWG